MKNITIALAALLLAGAGFFGFRAIAGNNQQAKETNAQESSTSTTQNQQKPAEQKTDGSYVNYSNDAIANAEGEVYLFFHAPWCAQCRSIESGIEADGVPEGVTVIKVDYDSNQELRQKYGVTLQTTFVKVESSGEFESKFVAYDDPHFSTVVRDYINK